MFSVTDWDLIPLFCKIHLHLDGEKGFPQLLKPAGLRNPQFCLRLCQNPSRLTPAL